VTDSAASTVASATEAELVVRRHAAFPLLDGYRALAATAVLLTHVGFQTGAALAGPAAGLLARLDFGVTVFFLLSGFLLYRPHAVAHLWSTPAPRVGPYLWRRALRILPAYWLAVLGAMLLLPENRHSGPGVWLSQLLLLQTYQASGLLPGLSQVWSLGTEVAFYLFLPLLGLLVHRLGGRDPRARLRRELVLLGGLAAASVAYRVWVFAAHADLRLLYWLPAYLDWFAVGMALAAVSAFYAQVPPADRGRVGALDEIAMAPGSCWLIGGALLALSTTVLGGPLDLTTPTAAESVTKHLLYAAAGAFLFLPGVLGPPDQGVVRRFLASAPLTRLGLVSYGVFLWNMAMLYVAMRVLDRALFKGGFWTVLALTSVLTVTVATLSWLLLEQPVMRRLRPLVR
jgi:peptidoglycan/LPS O-acetylase OafA/YrhL